jgi:hypothetical protein
VPNEGGSQADSAGSALGLAEAGSEGPDGEGAIYLTKPMKRPIINEEILNHEHLQVTMWQQTEDDCGVGEAALLVRSYNGTVEIRQEDRYIMLNPETVPTLCKYLKVYADRASEANRA